MKKIILISLSCLLFGVISWAQDGKILDKTPLVLPDSVKSRLAQIVPDLDSVQFFRITYLSDGLRVTGYLAEPKQLGQYPCIIANRGGNRDFGQWNPISIGYFLGNMASWGYVVVASQYRGNDGGEGTEEFGGRELQDVFNLVPVLTQIPAADTSRIGIQGGSRGGMMTYLALRESCQFKAAAVIAGMADAFENITARPDMEKNVFSELVPNYATEKEEQLRKRSAVYWADEICKTTPLLMMHGSADWRVNPIESIALVQKLFEYRHPTRFILFEGADHGIREFREEMFAAMKKHFDHYLRDGNLLPNMEPHGR